MFRTKGPVLCAMFVMASTPALSGAQAESGYVEHFMLFRSQATGESANAEQLERCAEHFADRGLWVLRGSDLDYRVWALEAHAETGLVVDHTATDLGPGFLCSVLPALDAGAPARAYAYMEFPGLPEIEVEGPCRVTATVNEGETFWHCRLEVLADATKGIYGGFMSTNSVLRLGSLGSDGWPTGSVWTAYIVEAGE